MSSLLFLVHFMSHGICYMGNEDLINNESSFGLLRAGF